MSGGGGKGGSQTTQVQIPEWLQAAAQRNIARAEDLAQFGYTPYYGPDVAALTPQQIAAQQGINAAAQAFGMPTADVMAGMPQATDYNGMMAYSSQPLYQQSLNALQANMPAQYEAMRAPFIDPVTGAAPRSPYGAPAPAPTMPIMQPAVLPSNGSDSGGSGDYNGGPSGGSVFNSYQGPNLNGQAGYGAGGYTSFGDMFDGGGPGRSGDTFQGGGAISAVGNALGGPSGRNSNDSGGSSGAGGGK
jgi:hypothetical protein